MLSSTGSKGTQSFYSIETYAYEAGKGLVSEKEDIRCDNKMKRYRDD